MLNITLHKCKEMFTVAFSISAMTEFVNIRNFTSLFLKDAMCYRINVAIFGISDLNSIWHTEYYAGRKKQAVLHTHKKCILYFYLLNLLS